MVYFASRYVFIMPQVFDGTYLNLFLFIGGHDSKFRLVCTLYIYTYLFRNIY